MTRREFLVLAGAATVWPLGARAQNVRTVFRIGILETQSASMNADNLAAFREGLRLLGYVEGTNLIIEYRSAEGRGELFPELASDLLHRKVDVIVTRGTPAVLAAKNATRSVPIVMAAVGEPLLVISSLAHPGGNVTGLSGFSNELEAKRVEVIKEMVPGATRIAGLYNMSNPVVPPQWNEVRGAAQRLGLESQLLDVRKADDIAPALNAATKQHVNALMVSVDALTQANRKLIVELAATHQLPAIYVSREFIEEGGLIAYGPSYPDLYRRAATYVDKIFKGAKPSELPVEQPTTFELIINLKTAKMLGLTVPPSLLFRADEVIE
jgi:putative tryptophan/tyrosine transport system substrate-binding protein